MSAPYSDRQLARKWLQYYLTADNGRGHGIHSPFVYDFTRKVLMDRRRDPAFAAVEGMRKRLKKDQHRLSVADYGAGSSVNNAPERKIADIARHAAKSPKLGQLLFRCANYFQPDTIIELGTSLGVSGAYLALGAPHARVYTLEGAAAVANAARANFKSLHLNNISVVDGRFDQQLPGVLQQTGAPGMVYIDGNHQFQPTLDYFHLVRDNHHNNTVIIFDDIHWSAGMEAAWEKIKQDSAVTCTIDLFFVGLVFFRQEIKTPGHFRIRY